MKHILTFLLVSILTYTSFSNTPDHRISYDGEYVFTIHIGAFVKARQGDFKEIRPYGFLYAQNYNNLLQVYMGDYPTESDAMKVLEKIKRHGYPDAFVTRRSMKKGAPVRVVQVASNAIGEDIDWVKYSAAGQLHAVLDNDHINLVTGPFNSSAEVNDYLSKLREIGFKDAFAKRINPVLLHKITSFEAGQVLDFPTEIIVPQKEETVVLVEKKPAPEVPSMIVKKKAKKAPKKAEPKVEKEVLTAREAIPESFDVVAKPERLTPKPKEEKKVKTEAKVAVRPKAVEKKLTVIAPPKIRTKVKRTSAIELQKILKAESAYSNSLDGYYGKGTAKAWETIKQTNPQLKKYILLATQGETLATKGTADVLQHYINSLQQTPQKSLRGLETSKEAIAKVYRAYYLFSKKGNNKEVNDLMNSAIQQTFAKKKLKNQPKFDYTATYDYTSVEQLILHLRYIQGATTPEPAAPIWLFNQHPAAAAKAFEGNKHPLDNSYRVQDCSALMDWEEVKLMKTILTDLNTNTDKKAIKRQSQNDTNASRLLLSSKALSVEEYTSMLDWNKALWIRMDTWAKGDALHQKLVTPLKITYFQSWVRLEDYFMDKGRSPREAKGLALGVLRNMVDVPLEGME